jgi:putative peptidoglycan binding protein
MSRPVKTTCLVALAAACLLALPALASARAVDGDGMWIWYVKRSSGGTAAKIAAKAARHGVKTVFIKSADGRSRWRQFSPRLVGQLKARGLKVCAWQFVYGRYPKTEAERAAEAARAGADCVVIDAEGHYEGKYVSAQSYIKRLRSRVGDDYEVALTSFPYVNYHPGLPYSVFLGPHGAQDNLPQMYWKTIGVSVDRIYQATWTYNRIYGRPIYPLGQTYSNPRSSQVTRFRKLAQSYGATGLSWWVWQYSGSRQWNALGSAFDPIGLPVRRDTWPVLKRRYRSDMVVWAQQHLMKQGLLGVVNGNFGSGTEAAVRAFQTRNALPVTGMIDTPTWQALLRTGPAEVRWSRSGHRASPVTAARARRGRVTMPVPLNAERPAARDELRGKPGR